jgi:hypothetical protein
MVELLSRVGSNNMSSGGEVMVVFSPVVAQRLAREGWSKADVRMHLFEKARAPVSKLLSAYGRSEPAGRGGAGEGGERWPAWLDQEDPATRVPVVRRPENIHVLVAGAGGTTAFSAVLGGWGYMGGFAETKPVRL